jgi:leucyl-tRNA synthetase
LYVRFWTKFLFDLGLIPINEPAKKLINQGMIQGVSQKIYRWGIYGGNVLSEGFPYIFNGKQIRIRFQETNELTAFYFSTDFLPDKDLTPINIDINWTFESILDFDRVLKFGNNWFKNAFYVCKEGYYFYKGNWYNAEGKKVINVESKFYTSPEVEKMSKSKLNVVSPTDIVDPETEKVLFPGIIEQFGADTLRMYEMFLGPLELSKPWSTHGIEGVFKFIRKFWRLFHKNTPGEKQGWELNVIDEKATKEELKVLHKTIKKIQDDIERYSFNTCVSTFMICVNEFTDLKCNKREILEPLTILLASFAPHVAEELWEKLGHKNSITYAQFPEYKEEFITENSFEYPVSVNGKTRFKIELPLDMKKEEVEKAVLSSNDAKKYLNGNTPKKVIVVPGRIVNIVL